MPTSTPALNIGDKILIRTVTYFQLGEITAINDNWITLATASWVADTGRLSTAIKDGTLNEVEYLGSIHVSAGAVVDIIPWTHELPTKTK
jgi:hypothetical protein